MKDNEKLSSFTEYYRTAKVRFVETLTVKEGVECDVYAFEDDAKKDLAIVRVERGQKTPLQKVLLGTNTIEGFVNGEGTLRIDTVDGMTQLYEFKDGEEGHEVHVEIGQTMQWHATGPDGLVFYEICEPPYQDGRYENLPE